jgi:tRNA 2-selenouridine synthase SelU
LDEFAVYQEMEVAVGLVLYRLDDARMAVAGIADAYAADEVKVAFTGAVVEVEPFRCYYLQSEWVRGCLCDVPEE